MSAKIMFVDSVIQTHNPSKLDHWMHKSLLTGFLKFSVLYRRYSLYLTNILIFWKYILHDGAYP
jgi:hypothetical protein